MLLKNRGPIVLKNDTFALFNGITRFHSTDNKGSLLMGNVRVIATFTLLTALAVSLTAFQVRADESPLGMTCTDSTTTEGGAEPVLAKDNQRPSPQVMMTVSGRSRFHGRPLS